MYPLSPKSHVYWPSLLSLWSRFSELSEMLSSRLGYSPYFAPNKILLKTLTLCFSFQSTLAYEAWLYDTALLLCQTPLQETCLGHQGSSTQCVCVCVCVCVCAWVVQSCPTLCDLMNYSPPGFSVHGILQARILEWIATPFSRVSSPTQESNPHLLWLPRWQADSSALRDLGNSTTCVKSIINLLQYSTI